MIEIMMNGSFVPVTEAKISVLDHGFLFGDSIYEVIRTRNGQLWAASLHLKRLRYSAERVAMEIPWDDSLLIAELLRMVEKVPHPECSLRLMITRGVGSLSIDPGDCEHPVRVIFGQKLNRPPEALYRSGASLWISNIYKAPKSHERGNPKTGNYLDNVLALRGARQAGAHEALLLNQAGMVTEGTSSNIFWLKNRRLMTPSLGAGILKGLSRQLVLKLAENLGIQVVQGLFTLETLLEADEVFITSTSREILPVSSIGDTHFAIGPVTRELMNRYCDVDVEAISF